MTGKAQECSAGVPPAASRVSRPRFGEVTIYDRGRPPHWEKDAATYFITFRLADSLPRAVLERIKSERSGIATTARQLGRDLSSSERKRIQQLSTKEIERYLDNGAGACHLKVHAVAEQVTIALLNFGDKRYRLFAWCVMPNHVHVVLRLFPRHKLAEVAHSWKSFTAKKANAIPGRADHFWQREYYDHLIREEGEFERAVRYVADNPCKAGLQNWPWVWVCGRDAHTTAGGTPALQGE